MEVTVAETYQPRLNLDGGRPAHPGIVAIEGLVEANIAIRDDATAFAHGSRHLAAMQRLAARLSLDLAARAERLLTVVVPELELAYEAAETVYTARVEAVA